MTESERIDHFNNGEMPATTKMVVTVAGVKNAAEVLENVKAIMKKIAEYGFSDNWPSDDQWREILPAWFVQSMTSKTSADRDKDPDLWHFESWIERMYNRAWVWWSSKVEKDKVTVVLETLNLPYLFEQFLYIFYSQGVPMINITVSDDVYNE